MHKKFSERMSLRTLNQEMLNYGYGGGGPPQAGFHGGAPQAGFHGGAQQTGFHGGAPQAGFHPGVYGPAPLRSSASLRSEDVLEEDDSKIKYGGRTPLIALPVGMREEDLMWHHGQEEESSSDESYAQSPSHGPSPLTPLEVSMRREDIVSDDVSSNSKLLKYGDPSPSTDYLIHLQKEWPGFWSKSVACGDAHPKVPDPVSTESLPGHRSLKVAGDTTRFVDDRREGRAGEFVCDVP